MNGLKGFTGGFPKGFIGHKPGGVPPLPKLVGKLLWELGGANLGQFGVVENPEKKYSPKTKEERGGILPFLGPLVWGKRITGWEPPFLFPRVWERGPLRMGGPKRAFWGDFTQYWYSQGLGIVPRWGVTPRT